MSDERDERLKKLDAIRALKVDPFGQRLDGDLPAGEIVAKFAELENKPVLVSGRITALRNMGKAAFLDVRDWTGKVQVHAKKDKLGDAWAVFAEEHGRAVLRHVELGKDNGLEAEVTKGLEAGERVVLHPSDRVGDGVRLVARS